MNFSESPCCPVLESIGQAIFVSPADSEDRKALLAQSYLLGFEKS
jgi:hypothetical protein